MKELKTILFWGAVWGILEATIGWIFHFVHFKGEVLLLYPFGLLCMLSAMRQCDGDRLVILKVAGIAALIKLVNLFTWTGVPAYYVVNPAVAILLEGMATFVFCALTARRKAKGPLSVFHIWTAFTLILVSFFVFKGWQVLMDRLISYNPDAHLFISGNMFFSWLWKSAVQGLMLVVASGLIFYWKPSERGRMQTVRWSFPVLIIAVLITVCL